MTKKELEDKVLYLESKINTQADELVNVRRGLDSERETNNNLVNHISTLERDLKERNYKIEELESSIKHILRGVQRL